MKLNKKKLERQNQFIEKWKANQASGTLEAVTGFGKTFVAVLIIKDMNERHPERTTEVIVPTLYLKSQWEETIASNELLNVNVTVINTAIKSFTVCHLLVLDEIHNYASTEFSNVFSTFKYNFILGLTATMERNDGRDALLTSKSPILDTITLKEALANNYVSEYVVYNLGIEMSPEDAKIYEDINKKFHFNFAQFEHNFDYAMRFLSDPSFRSYYCERRKMDESELMIRAVNFSRLMNKRKQFLYYADSKKQAVKQILQDFQGMKAITFAENVDFAIGLFNDMQDVSTTYHSKMKKKDRMQAMDDFNNPENPVNIMHTAKGLDEGFNVEGIELAIISSGTTSTRQDIQRTGRAIRYVEGKQAIIINLYIKGTQDETWLRKRQRKNTNITYVDSTEEIKARATGTYQEPVTDPIESGRFQFFQQN